MTTRAFKSISPHELEAAIASAISAITKTPTEVSIMQWTEVTGLNSKLSRQQRFDFQLSITATKSDNDPTLPENFIKSLSAGDDEQSPRDRIARGSLKDDLDPSTRDGEDTRPF